MLQNIVDFKAKSFLSERNTSTMAYEVKAVRALWDPSLSIPGTNRRGGWRCPTGTRYGGQITDRFGRSCGWGVARRIANQISDIGQRLENVDDARRGRRIARRERRILARLNPQDARAGRLERGLRGVAERLDGGEASTPRGGRRRTVTARPPSVDTPEAISEPTPDAPRPQRRRRQPARPVREDRNLLAAEPTEVLEEMRAELENATGGRDSDDYKRVMAELKRREAPARPARRRQPARRRGGNLRESEQRRMDREIEEPGAPRTGEAPARRRRRAVVEATKKPKAPVKKPEAVVEPKVVKPRRPKPNVDVRERDSRIERLIAEEEEISRRIRRGGNVDIGNPPKGFLPAGNGRWTVWALDGNGRRTGGVGRGVAWVVTVDREDERVLGLTATDGRGGVAQARNFDELVQKMNDIDGRRQGNGDNAPRGADFFDEIDRDLLMETGDSDNAANSERMRQAREDLRKRPATPAQPKPQNTRPQGWNRIPGLNNITHDNGDVIERERNMKWTVTYGIPGEPAGRKPGFASREDAIAWHKQNVLNRNAPAAPAVDPIDAPFIAPDKKDIRKAPAALKHEPPKIEVAKFDAQKEAVIEQVLIEIKDAPRLNQFALLVDQANFLHNEARQEALRSYQKALAGIAKKLREQPNTDVDALILNAKTEWLRGMGSREVGSAIARLNQLNEQLAESFIKLSRPTGASAQDKEVDRLQTMAKISQIKTEMGKLEASIQLFESLEPEVRKTAERIKQGYQFDSDATNIPKPTPRDVKKKIKDQIAAAIDRRQSKLSKYLRERHPEGGAAYEDMTPEQWQQLSQREQNAYVEKAYSHDLIKGKNGKYYNAVASVSGGRVSVTFNEVNAEGRIIRANIGTSGRIIEFGRGYVSQRSMSIYSKLDRGADIQTIYNQHAFLYLSKIGITKAEVHAADDGHYVWARVGFKQPGGANRGITNLEAPLRFYEEFGAGGLISNDAEYARIKSIVEQARNGTKFSHQDIIFAIDDVDDQARMEYVKQWFKSYDGIRFNNGVLKFADQKVAGVQRTRRARAARRTSPS